MKKNIKIEQVKNYEIDRDTTDNIMVGLHRKNACPTHYHKQIEILYVNMGRTEVEIDQSVFQMRRGDFIIIHPYTLHKFNSARACTSVICIPSKYSDLFRRLHLTEHAYTLIKASCQTRNIYRKMKKLKAFEASNEFTKYSQLYGLLGAVYESPLLETYDKKRGTNDISYQIITYINEHYVEEISLEVLAKHCGYSKNYVSKIFNTSFRCNVNEYVNIRRLQAFIERQSSSPSCSVSETALSVGFKSTRTFYNAFKEHYKMAPKDYLALKK